MTMLITSEPSWPDLQHLHGGDARRTASAPLTPAGCRCDRPLLTADDHGDVRCLRCGRATEGWR